MGRFQGIGQQGIVRSALFSESVHFPKLDVAGSIPVSRSSIQELTS